MSPPPLPSSNSTTLSHTAGVSVLPPSVTDAAVPLPSDAATPPSKDSTEAEVPRVRLRPPKIHPPITVPFISPLVLRKEVESVLEKEGDRALTGRILTFVLQVLLKSGLKREN
jgi:hypothetical protein